MTVIVICVISAFVKTVLHDLRGLGTEMKSWQEVLAVICASLVTSAAFCLIAYTAPVHTFAILGSGIFLVILLIAGLALIEYLLLAAVAGLSWSLFVSVLLSNLAAAVLCGIALFVTACFGIR